MTHTEIRTHPQLEQTSGCAGHARLLGWAGVLAPDGGRILQGMGNVAERLR